MREGVREGGREGGRKKGRDRQWAALLGCISPLPISS